ncbi:plasma-membrane proton-efflux P-type ATPase [Candidatus Kaiserbacteria bacterium]|nr:plasma-membrane proton-efflux P-type ATPase [Candidatus Kaiserbacteria bacterium]
MEHRIPSGLTTAEVEQIRKTEGFNEIIETEENLYWRFVKKIISPIPLMIEVALGLSIFVQRWEDAVVIAVLLIVNLAVDLSQEQKAHKALSILKKTLAPTAWVIRDNKLQEIPARELVPADVVKLAIGEVVPADVEIISHDEVTVDQSAITGESLPITATAKDQLYSGSMIQKGTVYAKVITIGVATAMGKNIELVGQAEVMEESHFQRAILRIGKFLIIVASLLVIFTSSLLLINGDPIIDVARFALVLAIASIPVALPAVLSVTMAIGANLLARRHTIVSNFQVIEELAGVSYLCVDKTGTLTKNEIAVSGANVYGQHTEEELFVFAYLALEDGERSSIERAVHKHVLDNGFQEAANKFTVKEFYSFDPVKKTTEAVFDHAGEEVRVIMGAPQVIAQSLSAETDSAQLMADTEALAVDGFRSLAVAIKWPRGNYPVGLIPLMDPPRDDSREVIKELKKRGVVVKMLTGDNTAIARYIGKLLNIGQVVVSRSELEKVDETPDDKDNKNLIQTTDIFAEVVPADKFNIVSSFQSDGQIVAMTGDGVNDAPALKKADVGIAVSGSTPAARSASDLVLLDNGLSVIKEAIDLARQTFARMQSYATFRISETIRIVFFIALTVLIFDFSPLTAGMVIMLALLNDIPVLAIAYDNVRLSDKPVRWHINETLIVASVLGVTGLISSFALLYYLDVSGWEIAIIQTIFFVKLDVAGHSTLYLTRAGRGHFWERPFPSLKFFLPAFSSRLIGSVIAYFGILMPAISLSTIALVWVYATVWFLINDQIKVLTYKVIDWYKQNVHPQPTSPSHK